MALSFNSKALTISSASSVTNGLMRLNSNTKMKFLNNKLVRVTTTTEVTQFNSSKATLHYKLKIVSAKSKLHAYFLEYFDNSY